MTNKVILVTEPDDILQDGLRLLLVNLTSEQTQIISDALTSLTSLPTIVLYVWNTGEISWLFDKKLKSDLIIFNAESVNEIIIGYMAAQKNSAYFGNLKDLSTINPQGIYNIDDCKNLLLNAIEKYEQQ
jgi:hypothetical protein